MGLKYGVKNYSKFKISRMVVLLAFSEKWGINIGNAQRFPSSELR